MAVNLDVPNSRFASKHVEFSQCALYSPLFLAQPEKQAVFSDIRPVISKLTIYENLFSPTLTGELYLQDDGNISTALPLMGIEIVTIKFNITDADGTVRQYGNSSPLVFSVYQQTERSPAAQGIETYRLGLTSPELFLLSEKRLSRAYKDMPVDAIVTDILRSPIFCNTKKEIDVEPAKSPINVVVPYLSPLDTIKLLTIQGQSSAAETNYTFFETLRGFHFRSIRGLIRDGQPTPTKPIPRITMQLAGVSSRKPDINLIYADNIEVVSGFDFLYQLSEGAFASTTIGVDIISGKYRQTISTANDDSFKNRMLVGGANAIPFYPAEFGLVNPSAKVFLVPTMSLSAANTEITSKDSSIKDNFIEQTLDGRNRELIALQSRCVRVKVSGVPEIHSGGLVDIVIPNTSNNNKFVRNEKDVASGRYLVVAVKHDLINTGTGQFIYETTFEACSDSTNT